MPGMSAQHVGKGGNAGDFVRYALDGLQVGPPTTFKKLTVFPLLRSTSTMPAYLTLAEAIAEGVARVTEVSQGGTVSELRVVNSSDRPVFLLDGEELIGAKQNRVVNLSILVPAKTDLNIPVSCVEMGRWAYRTPELASSPHAMYATGRARKVSRVSGSLRAGARSGDQSEVWEGIARTAALMDVASPTSAMSDMYDQYATSIDDYVAAFHASDDQVGALFAIGPRIYGFDLFDAPATMRTYHEKLVRSYALDALGKHDVADEPATAEGAQQMLDTTAQAAAESYPALGLGIDVRVGEEDVVGAGLLWDEHMVHLNAFADATAHRAPRPRHEAA
jgi:hypothetical protein